MRILLEKPIQGFRREFNETVQDWSRPRLHADAGDALKVILQNTNPTHYICDSKYYPGEYIYVFPSQCSVIPEVDTVDDHEIEKYYQVYEEFDPNSQDDPFYRALFPGDDE
jgi:hypothetical protein